MSGTPFVIEETNLLITISAISYKREMQALTTRRDCRENEIENEE
jgi:hypothetical protein